MQARLIHDRLELSVGAREEGGSKALEIVSEVTKPVERVIRESGIGILPRASKRYPHKVFMGEDDVAQVIRD